MTSLAWHRHGTAPAQGTVAEVPLVLLHAFPFDSTMWHDVVRELDDIPVLTVDAPGFGGSRAHEGEPSLATYADAVVADLAELGVQRAVVAGLSMGGYALLEIAARRPEMLAGLALVDTKATADTPAARQARLDAAEGALGGQGSAVVAGLADKGLSPITRANRPQVVEQVQAALAAAPPAGIAWAQRAMAARPDRLDVLGLISAPAVVISGEHDTMSTAEDARQMAGHLAHVELVQIPEAGHFTHVEAPAAVAGALHALYLQATRAH